MKQWRDKRHIGKVGPAQKGIIDNHHVTWLPIKPGHDIAHRISHTAQMHRNMSGLGSQFTPVIKYRTGKIKTIPNIRGESGALQYGTHFIADCIQSAGKDIEFNSIHDGNGFTIRTRNFFA